MLMVALLFSSSSLCLSELTAADSTPVCPSDSCPPDRPRLPSTCTDTRLAQASSDLSLLEPTALPSHGQMRGRFREAQLSRQIFLASLSRTRFTRTALCCAGESPPTDDLRPQNTDYHHRCRTTIICSAKTFIT
ncbi:hypothetical protein OJAV_G00169380 [Oryzias javanicus]|uniref:Secreted protein n=1 Tax=Oryzias javanicus TaxID=123683 RepID=A0A437CEM0_ORYJA|nr:hypothetical protein OJAV_G00169380 [Oryzias javanicus]